ncbi:MAG: hypothetical protein HC929_09470 [Leptolyngbyaceae cyanobacterium SM2_5_2]|nr:hypothetical protein [Leptolyngbyaceae cyanobacterium SM2_5_2]
MFGTIFGLIGGIFKAIGGLVGLGKKSEFYLELDEADSGSKSQVTPAVQPVAAVSAEPVAAAPALASPPAPVVAAPVAKPAQPAGPVPSFAANYVATPGVTGLTRRRRPGPSLSPFMDMAKTVKVR